MELDAGNSVYYNHVITFTGFCSSNHNIIALVMNLKGAKITNMKRFSPSISYGNRE